MDLLPHVHAQTFSKAFDTGQSRPSAFTCIDASGETGDYVVKFFSRIGSHIIFEYVAALIGPRLNIAIPSAAIVHIDRDIGTVIPDVEVSRIIINDRGPHFGTKLKTKGFIDFTVGTHLSRDMIEKAIDIFAFDMLVQNYDRATGPPFGKPNLLVRSDEIVVIDHEKTFACTDPISGSQYEPWELRELRTTANHIFYQPLRLHAEKHGIIFTSFLEQFMSIPEEFLTAVLDSIPREWQNGSHQEHILAHLRKVRENIALFERGLLEVFA